MNSTTFHLCVQKYSSLEIWIVDQSFKLLPQFVTYPNILHWFGCDLWEFDWNCCPKFDSVDFSYGRLQRKFQFQTKILPPKGIGTERNDDESRIFGLSDSNWLLTVKIMSEFSLIPPQLHRVAIKNTKNPAHIRKAAAHQKWSPTVKIMTYSNDRFKITKITYQISISLKLNENEAAYGQCNTPGQLWMKTYIGDLRNEAEQSISCHNSL